LAVSRRGPGFSVDVSESSKVPFSGGPEWPENQRWQAIPTQLDLAAFEQFVLPHLSPGSRGPAPKLSLHKIFNYILKHMYLGCQWKELAIDKDGEGSVEIHYTRIYRTWRRWVGNGFIDAIFAGSVSRLHQDGLLDTTVIHGDGTTTAAKKGGDNLGFSGHKKVKGDKVVAFCDRHCNVIAPFVSASANRNESPLLLEALPEVMRISREVGLDLQGTIVSLDVVYDCEPPPDLQTAAWFPTSTPIRAAESSRSEAASRSSSRPSSKSASGRSSGCLPGRTSSGGYCCVLSVSAGCTMHPKLSPTR
jgi:transposase